MARSLYRIAAIPWARLALGIGLLSLSGCANSTFRLPWQDPISKAPTPASRIRMMREMATRADKMPANEQEDVSRKLAQYISQEQDTLVRSEILLCLAKFPTETAERMLLAGEQDPSPSVRETCCQAWRIRGGPKAVDFLSRQLLASGEIEDENRDVRLAAARALGELRDPAAIAALGKALESEDPALQYRAVESLRKVSGKEFGDDVAAWQEYAQGGSPRPLSMVERVRRWF